MVNLEEIFCFSSGYDGSVENVMTGQTRAVYGKGGVPENQRINGTNRWMSDGLPAWFHLEWSDPVNIAVVELTFDTGLHRTLTLSQVRFCAFFGQNP